MKQISSFFGSILAASILLTLVGCAPKGGSNDARIAFAEDADAVLFVDINELNTSAFNQEAEKYTKSKNEQLPDELQEFIKNLETTLGITENDLLTFAISISGIEESYTAEDIQHLRLSIALGVNQSVTSEQLKSLIDAYAEDSSLFEKVKEEDYQGSTLFTSTDPDNPNLSLSVAVITSENSLFLFGDPASVKATLDRSASGKLAANVPLEAANKANLTASTGWFMVHFPPAILAEFEALKGSPQAAMFLGPAAPSLLSMTKLGGAYQATDTLNIELFTILGTEEDASQVKSFIDNTVGGMGRALSQQHLGAVPSLISSLSSTEEANALRIKTTMTVEDVKLFDDYSGM